MAEASAGCSSRRARGWRDRGCAALAWETAPDNELAQHLYDATGAERSTWFAYRLSLS